MCTPITWNAFKQDSDFSYFLFTRICIDRNCTLQPRVTLYTAGHLHTAVPHCSHSRAPIVHTAVPRENNEHGCVYLRCRAVCKLPGCVEGHPCNWIYLIYLFPKKPSQKGTLFEFKYTERNHAIYIQYSILFICTVTSTAVVVTQKNKYIASVSIDVRDFCQQNYYYHHRMYA